MTAAGRLDSERGHDSHPGECGGQIALHFPEAIIGTVDAHGARLRPDLEDVIVANVWEVLFPCRGEIDEELTIVFPSITSGGAVRSLVVLALVPDDAPDAVREPRLTHTPEEAPVNRAHI